jgi:hypothetical protein
MKLQKNKYYFIAIVLLGIGTLFISLGFSKGPPPPAVRNAGALDDGPPPPPGLSIDENNMILLIIAILFGFYIIYRHLLKTKTPI